jgi:hypothetical protein
VTIDVGIHCHDPSPWPVEMLADNVVLVAE